MSQLLETPIMILNFFLMDLLRYNSTNDDSFNDATYPQAQLMITILGGIAADTVNGGGVVLMDILMTLD